MKKIISIINLLLYLGVVTVNGLANILPINNVTTGEISDSYNNLFVPASITFSIWGLIYIQLLTLVVYNLVLAFRNDERKLTYFNLLLSLNFILNISWILLWHYGFILGSWLIMVLLLIDLILIDTFLSKKVIHTLMDKVAIRLTISIYLGWISVATVANTTALLVGTNWNRFGFSETIWGVIITITGGIIASLSLILKKNIPFALVFIWAYIGIIIKRNSVTPVNNYIVNSATGVIVILVILSIITYISIKPKKVVL